MNLMLLSFIFLFGSCLLKGIGSAVNRLGRARAEQLSQETLQRVVLGRWLFSKRRWQQSAFAASLTRHLLSLAYALCFFTAYLADQPTPHSAESLSIAALITLAIAVVAHFIFELLSILRPILYLKATTLIGTLFLLPLWPLSLFLYFLLKQLSPQDKTREVTSFRIKDKILEIFHDTEFAQYIDPSDQKLILSVVGFKERIAREVMVPRIDVYALDAETPLKEAAQDFLKEGYSRIPVFKDSVDNVIGVLYYKDALRAYAEHAHELSMPIEKLVKPVFYTPETKKISHLLQEFRSKKIHLAIVVDEYGGTEGIVTIEDILEELVGEIADEYDVGEEALYTPLPAGGWVVDAKMTINDIEEDLGIQIPPSPEYDTIGGYIFHKAGAIPLKGWRLHHDDFDLEILSSDERSIDKIRITPH